MLNINQVDIPADFVPDINELPGDLAQLAKVIEAIAPGQGVKIVLKLAEEYRGTSIYFHNLDWLKRKIRNLRIIERYDQGERVPDIARDVHLSERQIWKILGKELGEDKQMKLF